VGRPKDKVGSQENSAVHYYLFYSQQKHTQCPEVTSPELEEDSQKDAVVSEQLPPAPLPEKVNQKAKRD